MKKLFRPSLKVAATTAGLVLGKGRIEAYPVGKQLDEPVLIVNYGNGKYPVPAPPAGSKWLNHPNAVKLWSSKVATAAIVNNDEVMKPMFVPMTTDVEEARQWQRDNHSVVCRSVDRGSNSRGISVCYPTEELDTDGVTLYTRYVKNFTEYRVIAGTRGESVSIINIWKKYVRDGRRPTGKDRMIKTAIDVDGDWAFRKLSQEDCETGAEAVAIDAVADFMLHQFATLGNKRVDFCGIDIVYNAYYNKAYIVEVNTAAGLGKSDVQNFLTWLEV